MSFRSKLLVGSIPLVVLAFLVTKGCWREQTAGYPNKPSSVIEEFSLELLAQELGLDPSRIYVLEVTGEAVKAVPDSKQADWREGALGYWVTVHSIDGESLESPLVYRCYRTPHDLHLSNNEPLEILGHLYIYGWGQQRPSETAAKYAIPPPYPLSEEAWTSTSGHSSDFRLEVQLVVLGKPQDYAADEFAPQGWYWPIEMRERYMEKKRSR